MSFPRTGNKGAAVTVSKLMSIEEYRTRDSEAVLLCALETVRTEGADGLVLALRPRGKPVQTYVTGEYSRDPEKAMGLLSRVWAQVAQEESALLPVITGRAKLQGGRGA